jgi:hypothetical protein
MQRARTPPWTSLNRFTHKNSDTPQRYHDHHDSNF